MKELKGTCIYLYPWLGAQRFNSCKKVLDDALMAIINEKKEMLKQEIESPLNSKEINESERKGGSEEWDVLDRLLR